MRSRLVEQTLLRPEDSLNAIRRRLPNNGTRFLLCDAVNAIEESYVNDRLDGCSDEDDQLVACYWQIW